ncbi:MAG: sigma-70 family RNA polymerase sigma factor [Armatimonadota bacterium]|nr:sigma-70 family RNA polymerase sigma factor [Armatimonadota bacterium]
MRLFPESFRRNAPASDPKASGEAGLSEDDVDLFARLLAAHQDKLYRVAYRMAGHHEDAQDLLQDALLEAYRSFQKFQRGTYFDKWLYRIMTNTFIDRQRRRKRVGFIESLDAPLPGAEEGEGAGRDIPDWEAEPSRQLLRDTFDEPIQKALDALKPEFRMVLILADVEEFSYDEISEMMDSPIGTVRSRLHRARHDAASAGKSR